MCAKNSRAPKYMKQNWTEIRGETDKSRIVVGDFKYG